MELNGDSSTSSHWAPPFFAIWSGQAVSLLGSQLVQFALIWWLTKTTGSATVLAVASLVGLLPQVLLGPVIGTLVDRWNRRITMMIADSVIAAATLGLAFLFWSNQIEIWHIYLLMFVRSTAGGFHWPAMQASTSLMVPKDHLARIQGLNQMLQGGMNIVSAPLGAVLLEVLTVQGILFIDVFTALLAVLPLFFITIPQPRTNRSTQGPVSNTSFWEDFRLGLRYMFGWPGLVIIGVMAALINLLLSPAFALVPILVTQHFSGGAMQLAWLESILGIGVIAGGVTLSVWGGFKRRILTTMFGLMGVGLGCLLVGFTPATAYTLALAATFVIGFSIPITNGPLVAVVQAVVPPEMQGRVLTLINSASAAMSPLGLIIAGPLADTFGVQSWFVIGGVVTLGMGLAGYFIPAVIHLEDGRGGEITAPADPLALVTSPAASSVDGD
jgi:DHA3 family macrolide efflux protein-like MFS transporter